MSDERILGFREEDWTARDIRVDKMDKGKMIGNTFVFCEECLGGKEVGMMLGETGVFRERTVSGVTTTDDVFPGGGGMGMMMGETGVFGERTVSGVTTTDDVFPATAGEDAGVDRKFGGSSPCGGFSPYSGGHAICRCPDLEDWFYDPVPSDYVAPNTSERRDDTLNYIWSTFLGHAETSEWYGWETISAHIEEWSASTEPGYFWDFGFGYAYNAFLYAIKLLYAFRDLVPDYGCCYGMSDAVLHLYHYHVVPDSRSTNWVTYGEDGSLCPTGFANVEGFAHVHCFLGFCSDHIYFDTSAVEVQGRIADIYLYWAHRAVQAYRDGVIDKETCDQTAFWASHIALGAIAYLSTTILHEIGHIVTGGDECATDCCMDHVSFTWRCRVSSYLGLVAADPASDLDNCGDQKELVSSTVYFSGKCSMNRLGVATGDSSEWAESDIYPFTCRC